MSGLDAAQREGFRRDGFVVLPGPHVEVVHEHVPDRRPHARYGYVEIVDFDMSRAARVDRFRRAGTLDRSPQASPVNHWLPVRRRAAAAR